MPIEMPLMLLPMFKLVSRKALLLALIDSLAWHIFIKTILTLCRQIGIWSQLGHSFYFNTNICFGITLAMFNTLRKEKQLSYIFLPQNS